LVKPVSHIAASVVMAQLAPHYRKGQFTPLRDVAGRGARGYELENQVITLLADGANMVLPAKTLDGNTAAFTVPANVGERILFGVDSEVVAHPSSPRLYVPTDCAFACDAITMPPTSAAASEPIVVWETSVTSPQDSSRVTKVGNWFRPAGTRSSDGKRELPAGIITALRKAHPARPIICALCWPENLVDASKQYAYKDLVTAAERASSPPTEVRMAVVDLAGLQVLGVVA